MSQELSYFNFLWKSGNDHGVHSPFVFSFITRCFYANSPKLSAREYKSLTPGIDYKTANVLYRTIRNLRPAKLFVPGDNAEGITELIRYAGEKEKAQLWFFSPLAPVPGSLDLAYISGSDSATILALLEKVKKGADDKTVCIMDNIHSSLQMEKTWKTIQRLPEVTVTIDTYHLGFFFLGRKQAKQHFILRPSRSFVRDAVLGLRNLYGLLG